MQMSEYVSFAGKVEYVMKNGYAVHFDHDDADVFDLVIMTMKQPVELNGRKIDIILNDSPHDILFVEPNELSFDVRGDEAVRFLKRLRKDPWYNFLYTSFFHNVRLESEGQPSGSKR